MSDFKVTEPTTVDLLRHGEPTGGRMYRGGIDHPLSELGWGQMWAAVGDDHPWDQLVCSPLQRCLAFASDLADRAGIPVEQEVRFREIGFGRWEGCTADEVRARWPEEYAAFYHNPVEEPPKDAERLNDFVVRVAEGFSSLLARHAGKQVLLVSHAGVMRALLATIFEMPLGSMYRLNIPNAAMIHLSLGGDRGTSVRFGN